MVLTRVEELEELAAGDEVVVRSETNFRWSRRVVERGLQT